MLRLSEQIVFGYATGILLGLLRLLADLRQERFQPPLNIAKLRQVDVKGQIMKRNFLLRFGQAGVLS